MEILTSILLASIPLFVAIDTIGNMPLFVGLTEDHSQDQKKRLAIQAVLAAGIVGFSFGAVGNGIFAFLGITSADFRVGGGILLLALSLQDLLTGTPHVKARESNPMIGVVPLGVPLIMGPAALTTLLIMQKSFGYLVAFVALFLNLVLVWVTLNWSARISRLIGPETSKAVAKIVAILLAAIAVMMIRTGILEIFQTL